MDFDTIERLCVYGVSFVFLFLALYGERDQAAFRIGLAIFSLQVGEML